MKQISRKFMEFKPINIEKDITSCLYSQIIYQILKFTFHHKYSRCNSGPTLFVTNQPKILGKGWVEHNIGLNIGDNAIPLLVVWLPKKVSSSDITSIR